MNNLYELVKLFTDAGHLVVLKADGVKIKIYPKLDGMTEHAAEPEPVVAAPTPPKKTAPKKNAVDHGKIVALANAGWSVAKIAEEMRCADQTVRNHLKEEQA